MNSYNMYNNESFIKHEENVCNECYEKRVKECCNKCGEGLCLNESCCKTFPHHNNDIFIICNGCITGIEKKLRPTSVDMCDLRLLKQKINKKMELNIKKLKVTSQESNQPN